MDIKKLIRENEIWDYKKTVAFPDTILRQLNKNSIHLIKLNKRLVIMERILVFSLIVLSVVVVTSVARADSVTMSSDSIEYEGYSLSGQSVAFNHKMGKYGYEIAMQRFDSYSLNQQNGYINVRNELDLSNISLGLYREIDFNRFYIKPIIGVIHSTINVKTVLRYQRNFKALDYEYPVDLKYEQYSSKTAILPLYGATAGYNFNKYFGVFAGYRYQGYDVKTVGVKFEF